MKGTRDEPPVPHGPGPGVLRLGAGPLFGQENLQLSLAPEFDCRRPGHTYKDARAGTRPLGG